MNQPCFSFLCLKNVFIFAKLFEKRKLILQFYFLDTFFFRGSLKKKEFLFAISKQFHEKKRIKHFIVGKKHAESERNGFKKIDFFKKWC
jgi:hypothetical protein